MKILEKNPLFDNVKQPLFSSRFYYLFYAHKIVQNLKRQQVEVVHIFTFSQFIPIFRRFNPEIKIVFHMQDGLVTRLDPKRSNSKVKLICPVEYLREHHDKASYCSYFTTFTRRV